MWKIGTPPASPALTITQHTCLNHKAQPSGTRSLQTRAVLWGSTCTWRWRGFTLTSHHPHQSKSTIIHCTTWSCLWRDHCSLSEPSCFPTSLLVFWCVICKSPVRRSRAATSDGANPSQRCPYQPQSCSRPGSETQPVQPVPESQMLQQAHIIYLNTGLPSSAYEVRSALSCLRFSPHLLIRICSLLLFRYKQRLINGFTPQVQWSHKWQKCDSCDTQQIKMTDSASPSPTSLGISTLPSASHLQALWDCSRELIPGPIWSNLLIYISNFNHHWSQWDEKLFK